MKTGYRRWVTCVFLNFFLLSTAQADLRCTRLGSGYLSCASDSRYDRQDRYDRYDRYDRQDRYDDRQDRHDQRLRNERHGRDDHAWDRDDRRDDRHQRDNHSSRPGIMGSRVIPPERKPEMQCWKDRMGRNQCKPLW